MGIQLEISLDRDIREINQFMSDLKFAAVTKSARQALNRTAKDTQSNAIREIRKRRKLKLKDLKGTKGKRGFVNITKAKGKDITQLEAFVNFSGIPLPMILFILGKAEPRVQTLPNRRRKSRRFEVNKGDKKGRKGLFVQKATKGSRQYQVFRRSDPKDKSKGFKLQSAPSIASYLRSKRNILSRIENEAIATLQKNYDSVLAFNLSQLKL